jgi:hypothetical protein
MTGWAFDIFYESGKLVYLFFDIIDFPAYNFKQPGFFVFS